MPSKRNIRELALQLLFLWDSHGQRDEEMTRQAVADGTQDAALRARATELAGAAWDQRQVTDAWIERLAPQWPPRRQPVVDRNLIRLAVWELTGTEQSPSFVNGVLDAVLKEKQALTSKNDEGGNSNDESMTNAQSPNDETKS